MDEGVVVEGLGGEGKGRSGTDGAEMPGPGLGTDAEAVGRVPNKELEGRPPF